ncbi:MAG: SDR family oxidoreductase [Myxococcales bacterium]|nr:SDR family oxidoreductase [Myxococcales bacterium]
MSAIVVTGASRGIGRAVAERLLDAGRPCVLVARDRARLEEVAKGRVHAYPLVRDLIEEPEVVEAAAAVAGELGGLVHAAGVALHAPLEGITLAQLDAMHRLHVVAPLVMAQAFARRGAPGAIVNVASTLGLRPAAGRLAYAATKAALISMTRTLALELADRSIRVNAVAPGVVDTDMVRGMDLEALAALHPLGLGTPADVAGAILFLLDAPWVTGTILTIDGGLTAG